MSRLDDNGLSGRDIYSELIRPLTRLYSDLKGRYPDFDG